MATAKPNPLQLLVNAAAIRLAEQQFRLARLWIPYGRTPERVDYDRVAEFMGNPMSAFPQPTDGIRQAVERIAGVAVEQVQVLEAFKAQGTEPTLSADQLYQTARANVINPALATAA